MFAHTRTSRATNTVTSLLRLCKYSYHQRCTRTSICTPIIPQRCCGDFPVNLRRERAGGERICSKHHRTIEHRRGRQRSEHADLCVLGCGRRARRQAAQHHLNQPRSLLEPNRRRAHAARLWLCGTACPDALPRKQLFAGAPRPPQHLPRRRLRACRALSCGCAPERAAAQGAAA